MREFNYHRPRTVAEAAALLATIRATVVKRGT